jgi:hypothetical protein
MGALGEHILQNFKLREIILDASAGLLARWSFIPLFLKPQFGQKHSYTTANTVMRLASQM